MKEKLKNLKKVFDLPLCTWCPLWLKFLNLFQFHRMPAELVAHGGQQLGGITLALTTDKTLLQRKCDDRCRHVQVDGLEDRPAAFAAIIDVAGDVAQVLVLLERQGGQVQQP